MAWTIGWKKMRCLGNLEMLIVEWTAVNRRVTLGIRMVKAVSKMTGLRRNKDRMDTKKVRAIMETVADPAVLYGRQI